MNHSLSLLFENVTNAIIKYQQALLSNDLEGGNVCY